MGDPKLKEAVAMALGGMIGGGIYSAFGIVVAIAGNAAWFAFLLAGLVAMCAGYSYVKLNEHMDGNGGAPSFIREFTGYGTLAGMTGWTLLFGYIGSMALYAYAFAGFFSEMIGRLHVYGLPVFSVVVVAIIGAFVALNLVGVGEVGKAEDFLTAAKVLVIGVFGLWGIWFALKGHTVELGFDSIVSRNPIMAAAMSFVAFQGWQLLMYGQDQFENPFGDVKKAIYISIPAATVLYAIVAVTTTSLLRIEVIAVAPGSVAAVRGYRVHGTHRRVRHRTVGAVLDGERGQRDPVQRGTVLEQPHRHGADARVAAGEREQRGSEEVGRHPRRALGRLRRLREPVEHHLVRVARLHRRLRRDEPARVHEA
jgi:amino acid transporter